jgi:hypothetical protein
VPRSIWSSSVTDAGSAASAIALTQLLASFTLRGKSLEQPTMVMAFSASFRSRAGISAPAPASAAATMPARTASPRRSASLLP